MDGTSGDGEHAPYFFLSYARTPSNGDRDPGILMKRFYDDLCHEVFERTFLPHDARAGFMDADLKVGVEWERRLARELATCRVFVPMYNRRYFHSVQCGKEWAAFDLRRQRHREEKGEVPEVIIPALWLPVPDGELPEMAKSIQFTHDDDDLRGHYLDKGLCELIRLRQHRDRYLRAVKALANRIIQVAEGVKLAAMDPPCDYKTIRSAFPGDPGRKFTITVVAGTSGKLRSDRSAQYYGDTAVDWNPYHPQADRPIAQIAADIVREMDFDPVIGSWHDQSEQLLSSRSPSSPGLVLLDPWAVADPRFERLLRELDQAHNPWIGVVVPWSRTDAQIAEQGVALREHLHTLLPTKIAQGRPATRRAALGLASLEEFKSALRPVVQALGSAYLRKAQTYPPQVTGTERPRLWSDPPEQGGMS